MFRMVNPLFYRALSCSIQCHADPNCIAFNFIKESSARVGGNFNSSCQLATYGHALGTGADCAKEVYYVRKVCGTLSSTDLLLLFPENQVSDCSVGDELSTFSFTLLQGSSLCLPVLFFAECCGYHAAVKVRLERSAFCTQTVRTDM